MDVPTRPGLPDEIWSLIAEEVTKTDAGDWETSFSPNSELLATLHALCLVSSVCLEPARRALYHVKLDASEKSDGNGSSSNKLWRTPEPVPHLARLVCGLQFVSSTRLNRWALKHGLVTSLPLSFRASTRCRAPCLQV